MRFLLLLISLNASSQSLIEKRILDMHNQAREEVSVPPLVWDATLSTYAKWWADSLAKTEPKMFHSPLVHHDGRRVGENIFWTSDKNFHTILDAFRAWYIEIENYQYSPITGAKKPFRTGHYTQIVWRNTTHVGMGVAYTKKGMVVVCSYYPAGNVINQHPY
jgi:uncharacterized protein YkwD